MNNTQAVCNYALLQFLPYPETGEFVNVGVLVTCQQPCLLHFKGAQVMPERVKAMFPDQNEKAYADAMAALQTDMDRAKGSVRDPKTCQLIFGELVRRRESTFRFGEVRTILTNEPRQLVENLFRRDVLMESRKQPTPALVKA
ncbi:MAG: DUF3037 domain-containing protein [Verrucomicrobiaceae bacterium]|nr:DUF3037 domain-containing protein [Verrucomicrobiaceae bacterium]